MFRKTLLSLVLMAAWVSAVEAQKLPTATRSTDIQAGGEFVYGHSDYGPRVKGYGGYATVDFRPHLGIEFDYRQAYGANQVYERSYEAGGRYVLRKGRWNPYVRLMYGRGVFNFPPYFPGGKSAANLAYNMAVIGGGTDFKLKPYLNLRGDFEYQNWFSGLGLDDGLTPYLGSIGVAYHFR